MSRKFSQNSQKTKIIKAKLKKNDYTSSGFSLLNYVLTISKVFGTSDHLEVLFSKCPKNIVEPRYIYIFFVEGDLPSCKTCSQRIVSPNERPEIQLVCNYFSLTKKLKLMFGFLR